MFNLIDPCANIYWKEINELESPHKDNKSKLCLFIVMIIMTYINHMENVDIKNDFIKKDSRMTWHNNHP